VRCRDSGAQGLVASWRWHFGKPRCCSAGGWKRTLLKPVIIRGPRPPSRPHLESLVIEPAFGGLHSPSSPDSLCGLQLWSLLFQRIALLVCQWHYSFLASFHTLQISLHTLLRYVLPYPIVPFTVISTFHLAHPVGSPSSPPTPMSLSHSRMAHAYPAILGIASRLAHF
jgi:hypothetical protein